MGAIPVPALYTAHAPPKPTLQDQWRAINLFGRNVASYKFALAEALLTLAPAGGNVVRLDELAKPFALAVCRHLHLEDKQSTSASSSFLAECRRFNQSEIDETQLIATTLAKGFNNVIDAFHVVGQGDVPQRFFIDERATSSGIRITDDFSRLLETASALDLPNEVEARWRLVETAWRLQVGRAMIAAYDDDSGQLLLPNRSMRRVAVTSCRDALNGYQQGKCFYCSSPITVVQSENLADVDHYFPHALRPTEVGHAINGVWNLVLACRACNRGEGGKSARVPHEDLLARLHARNEFLIGSHHPLRETLIAQTGTTEAGRRAYLTEFDGAAISKLIHRWKPRD
ncbi:HNH endonuclease domain-containing protein [Variovorax sp. J22P240]|uniref:HNH endonuclease domain-containing protein n=1 Tax=Variovorax sp. J22P240 TaxID=3053514 RepID=UPI002577A665|nr:HNH endonuclease domain-containing protein [Variovorax sp. J22P240]MDL9997242.1 HNH endonuclease domain-containing protein [Variovorax sp. J22P240]